MIRKLLSALAPITLAVHWEGDCVLHKAHNREEALEWMRCYPADAVVFVYNRFQRKRGFCAAIRGLA